MAESNPRNTTEEYYTQWTGEEARLTSDPRGWVNHEMHRRLLDATVGRNLQDMSVLEIGAGSGLFTRELLARGALVTVTDLVQKQLDDNKRLTEAAIAQHRPLGKVREYAILDLALGLEKHQAKSFDVVVAFGGPLSYTFEQERLAMEGMLRVGRRVLGSVMSLDGMIRWYQENRPEYLSGMSDDVREAFLRTGDMRPHPAPSGHACRQFRSADLAGLVQAAGGEITHMVASNYYSMHKPYQAMLDDVARKESAAALLQALFATEYEACNEFPDSGTHLLFAAHSK